MQAGANPIHSIRVDVSHPGSRFDRILEDPKGSWETKEGFMTPQRIQRKHSKGWRMPPNTVYVGRPTKWGNPFTIGKDGNAEECVEYYRDYIGKILNLPFYQAELKSLRGKNLCCWCTENDPCHADVLLEIANI